MLSDLDDTISIECDFCSNDIETLHTSKAKALSYAMERGWTTNIIDGERYHFCCKECETEFK